MRDLPEIFIRLKALIASYSPPLNSRQDSEQAFDLWSDKDLVIEGRKRKEVFFASAIIQKNYVGFYFMPIYVEKEITEVFKPELLRLKKGLSCFHIKDLTPELEEQITEALRVGFELYEQRGWV